MTTFTLKVADILNLAVDKYLHSNPTFNDGGGSGEPVTPFAETCLAITSAVSVLTSNEDSRYNMYCKAVFSIGLYLRSRLGFDYDSAFDNVEDKNKQQSRALWLTFAATVAADENAEITFSEEDFA